MGIKDFFRQLRGDSASNDSAEREGSATPYNGFVITPVPNQQSGQYLAAGRISKAFPDGERATTFIRADAHSNWDDACTTAINKAKRIIDEQGDNLFD